MNGIFNSRQISLSLPAVSKAICCDSITQSPAIKNNGRLSPTSNPHSFTIHNPHDDVGCALPAVPIPRATCRTPTGCKNLFEVVDCLTLLPRASRHRVRARHQIHTISCRHLILFKYCLALQSRLHKSLEQRMPGARRGGEFGMEL